MNPLAGLQLCEPRDPVKEETREMDRLFVTIGSLSGFLGVALGAFAAHALANRIDADMLASFEVGVRYQMYHSFALLAVGWAHTRWPGAALSASGWVVRGWNSSVFGESLRSEPERCAVVRSDHTPWGLCIIGWMAVPGLGSTERIGATMRRST